MPLPSVLSTRDGAGRDIIPAAEVLRTYRLCAVIASALIPFFWVVFKLADPAVVDPLWMRATLTAATLALLLLSYSSDKMARQFIPLMHVLLYVYTLWFIGLSAANAFSPNYAIGLLFVIAAIAVAVSTGLRRTRLLTVYLLFAVGLTTLAVLVAPGPAAGSVGLFIFMGCVASIALVVHIAASATIRAQAQISISEQKYRKLFASANDAILVVEPADLRVIEVNKKALELYGYAEEELVGLRVDVLGAEPWFGCVPADNLELVHHRRDGTLIHLLVSTALIEYDGRTAYLSINHDVSEHLRTLDSLSRANDALILMNRDLQAFTSAASHDLQEPVRKIQTFSDLIRREYGSKLDETGREYLERVQQIGAQMSDYIVDLLHFSRVSAEMGPFYETDLAEPVRCAVDELRDEISEAGARVVVGSLPAADVEPDQIRVLIKHLIQNALQARRDGVAAVIGISGTVRDGTCRLEVTDNGVGIEPHHFERIFSPFRQLQSPRPRGRTGMGLAICKRIVEHHGGIITLESTPGSGTTFVVELPRRHGAPVL